MRVLRHAWPVVALIGFVALGLLGGCAEADSQTEPAALTAEETEVESPDLTAADSRDFSALLTPADVEAISGLSGLTTVPYDPMIGAGGHVNIAEADGQLVAMLIVEDVEFYDMWKGDSQTYLRDCTPAVGEESFIGPHDSVTPDSYLFGFRSGSYAVVVDTFFRVEGVTKILSVEQLAELAAIVESRL